MQLLLAEWHPHHALCTYKEPLLRPPEKSRPSLQPAAGHLLPAVLRPSDLKAHLLWLFPLGLSSLCRQCTFFSMALSNAPRLDLSSASPYKFLIQTMEGAPLTSLVLGNPQLVDEEIYSNYPWLTWCHLVDWGLQPLSTESKSYDGMTDPGLETSPAPSFSSIPLPLNLHSYLTS